MDRLYIEHQKYQVKWLRPQSPQSIDISQAEREYDEGDIKVARTFHKIWGMMFME